MLTPRDGKSATLSSPMNQPTASATSRASVSSGRSTQKPAAELLVERREQERQRRLRHAGARRQRRGEGGQALVGAEALDERCGAPAGP